MEFASYLAGERWSDHPACTHPLLALLARHVNDYISDEARQALVGLVPDVIGLTGSDLRIDVRIALRAARTALPVVAEERQWAMATAVLTCERLMADLERQGFHGMLIWDAALLVESGGHNKMDKVVVVTTDPATQLRRLMARDGSTEEAARARTASQMPLAVKARVADYVIDNSGTREATEARVREVYRALLEDLRQQQARR